MGFLSILMTLGGAGGEPGISPPVPGDGGELASIGYGRDLALNFPSYIPACFARSRFNYLIMVNGLTRGYFWDGVSGAAEKLGMDSPEDDPPTAVADPGGGNMSEGLYQIAIRYRDIRGIVSDLSPSGEVETNTGDGINWSIPYPTSGRAIYVETYRTKADVSDPFYKRSNHTVGGVIYSSVTHSAGAATKITTVENHSLTGTETILISGHSRIALNDTGGYTPTVIDNKNFTIPVAWTADGFGGTFTRTGAYFSFNDQYSDDQLGEGDFINVTEEGGEAGARGKYPPPNNKMVAAQFQDRMWYAGDPEYDEGTVSVTNTSATVTGSGTSWTQEMTGRNFYMKSAENSFRTHYTISSVISSTELVLDVPFTGTTDSALLYVIENAPIERNQIYFSAPDEPESVPVTNVIAVQENTGDDDKIIGLMPYGPNLYILKERHIYSLSFSKQPIIDAAIALTCHRGVFSNRCWDTYEGTSYMMDQHGCYAFNGFDVTPISQSIQNYFRDPLLDLAYSKWFHVKVDPRTEVVRFYVKFTGDTGTRPKRSLCYNVRSGAWWVETYQCEIGDAVQAAVSGVLRAIFGSATDLDIFFTHSVGTADGVSTAIRGAVTSATTGTLSDSTNPFTVGSNPKPGSSIAILSGTGVGQIRRITAFPSTQAQVSISPNWTTTPDTTSTYAVGAVPWSMRTKILSYVGTHVTSKKESDRNERSVQIVYQPTTNSHPLAVERTINHKTTAETNPLYYNHGNGWTQEVGSTESVFDMTTELGWTELRFPDGQQPGSSAPKYLTLEFSGFQVDDQIVIHDIYVVGAE